MTLHVHDDVEQRSEKWFDLRRGMVTASNVGKLVTVRKLGALDFGCPNCGAVAKGPCVSKKDASPLKTLHSERTPSADQKVTVLEPASNDESRGLTLTLAAERVNEFTDPSYTNDHMFRGVIEEPFAVDAYSVAFAPVQHAGFIVRREPKWTLGYSPDGLVGDDGLIEVKSRLSRKQMHTVLTDAIPQENVAQCQAALLVTGREWLDYVSYSNGMALWVKRIFPDPRWQKVLVDALVAFEANCTEAVAQYVDSVAGLPMTERINFDLEMVV